jgi:LPS-assembly lipoprotein
MRIALAVLAMALLLAACGFHLRGQAKLPFDTLYVDGNTALLMQLKRNIAAGTNTKLVNQASAAEAIFAVDHEVRDKVILSLDTSGRVIEYQLRYRVGFTVRDGKGRDLVSPNEIALTRDVTFNNQPLAIESEEALLYRDMQNDVVQQIVRRLAAAQLAPQG